MSVTNYYCKVIYLSDGSTSNFPFTFNIYVLLDIVVVAHNIATAAETILTPNTDYTVAMTTDAPSPGSVTLIGAYAALATGYEIIIRRILPITQEIVLMENEETPAETFEEGYDRAIMIIQQLQEQLSRAILQDLSHNTPINFNWNSNAYVYFVIPETPLIVDTDKVGRFPIDFNGTIVEVLAEVSTAPIGSTIVCDIKKNGTSIWSSTPSNMLTIADGANSGSSVLFDTADIIQGDYLTIDLSQVGSTSPGNRLVVRVKIDRS